VGVALSRNRILCAVVILLVCSSFAFGFFSSKQMKRSPSSDVRQQYLLQAGDAPPAVRAEVLATLRIFQEGYLKRDPGALDSFMARLFSENDDVLLLGTDAHEWIRGYRAVREFIRGDWLYWGDFRIAVGDSIIWSSGDVAWTASIGVVHSQGLERPIRFSAIMVRNGDSWRMRNLVFQWDERDPGLSDLLDPSTHIKLLGGMFRKVRDVALALNPEFWLTVW